MPADFGTALAQNEIAMKRFEIMTDYEKESVIQWAQNARSRQEIQQLVDNIASETGKDPEQLNYSHFY